MESQALQQPRGRPFTAGMAAQFGRIGGARSSAAKTKAARRNGRKGGRPRKSRGLLGLLALRADLASVIFACPRCRDPKCRWRSIGQSLAVCLTCGAIFEQGPLGVMPRWLTRHEVSQHLGEDSNVADQLMGALIEIVTARQSRVRSKRARRRRARRSASE